MAKTDVAAIAKPADSEPDTNAPPPPTAIKVYLVREADWAGGHQSIPVGGGIPARGIPAAAWDLAFGEHGLMFTTRRIEYRRAYFVPYTAVQFVEYLTE